MIHEGKCSQKSRDTVPLDLSEYYHMYVYIHVLFSSMYRIELWNLEKTIELVHINISLSA
jgi:hypothetical protein